MPIPGGIRSWVSAKRSHPQRRPGRAAAATSFFTDEYRIIEVQPDGTFVSETLVALPAECKSPGHALWLDDAFCTLLVTCNATDNILVDPKNGE